MELLLIPQLVSISEHSEPNYLDATAWLGPDTPRKTAQGTKGPAHSGDANRPRGWPQTLLIIFPLRGTFRVPSLASDHTRSRFNDGGGFYGRSDITPEDPVNKIARANHMPSNWKRSPWA